MAANISNSGSFQQTLNLYGASLEAFISAQEEIESGLSKHLGYAVSIELIVGNQLVEMTIAGQEKEIAMRSYLASKVAKYFEGHPNLHCDEVKSKASEEHERNLPTSLLGDRLTFAGPAYAGLLMCVGRSVYFAFGTFPDDYLVNMLFTFIGTYIVGFLIIFFIETFFASS